MIIIINNNNNNNNNNNDTTNDHNDDDNYLAADNPWGGPSYPLSPGRIGTLNVGFLQREENWKPWEKTLGARTRTNNKLNSNVTLGPAWATAEEGECSRHCAIPAPLKSFLALQLFSLFHDLNVWLRGETVGRN